MWLAVALLFFVLTFVLTLTCFWYLHWFKYFKGLKNIPGPTPLPIIGNVLEFGNKVEDALPSMMRMTSRYGGLVKLMLGIEPVIIISDHEILKLVHGSSTILRKSYGYGYFRKWLNNGLLINTGESWRKRRKLITPAFHFQVLEKYVEVFDEASRQLLEVFDDLADKGSYDVSYIVKLWALDVICQSAMGISVNALENKNSEYVKAVNAMGKIVMDRSFRPLEQYDLTYRYTKNYQIEQNCLKVLHGQTRSVIEQRKRAFEGGVFEEGDAGRKRKVAFLDLLLQSKVDGQPLSEADVQEEVDTFMFEGHDTISSGINFALYNLSEHPEVQAKAFEEQQELFGGFDRPMTTKDLNEMKYLDMFVKESLRLYPPVSMYGRELDEDVHIPSMDTTIKKGTAMFMFPYAVHRDPKYFENPEEFIPERFSTDLQSQVETPYKYLAFSAGPRNCIGQKFAMYEMKCILSKILRRFEILPAVPRHVPQVSAETILISSNGIVVSLRHRLSTNL